MNELRVLVADDQKIVRDGVALLLGLIEGITVVGTAIDGNDAVRQARSTQPDLVLMDLNMPHLDGVEATAQILAELPHIRVVVMTTYDDDAWVFRALRAGARGYLTKDSSAEDIERALRSVAAGDAQLDPSVQRRLLDALATQQPATSPTSAAPAAVGLTAREQEVLQLIAEGLSNDEVTERLHVSMATVKTHIGSLLSKTGSRDRAQLVIYAFRTGAV
ncbi:response regulator transcription factor [Leifsonia sp. fls2-241-R2A-40a]|uniref:response regulator transcription factor n=1 Tax=Leifsonia sp. fls2-241-R2A-40a TaxID=3040290 RepID=UPI00254B25AC|nr:response regulator transcription factor [Leifsonia sp. fls2-241-R2A-40a]